jgi:hypothetical protein
VDTPKPLGYWLQHLHNLLEIHFPLVLSDLGVDRRMWQLLNTLALGSRTYAELEQALAPFWTAGQSSLHEVLGSLDARGWCEESHGTVVLSSAGAAAHADLTQRVKQARAVVLQGLTPDDYGQAIRTLSAMAANVEAAIASHQATKAAHA